MIKLGNYNTLTIQRFTEHGAYLDGGQLGGILMPKNYVEESMRPGDEVEVFVYLDQQERLVATKETPLATVGDFAFLQVSWVNNYGAFLNWGVMKDLFVPFREQKMKMELGRSYIVYIYIDEETHRIVGTAKVERYLLPAPRRDYYRGKEVDILVWQRTAMGLKVIVDNRYAGLVYNEELIGEEPRTGHRLRATVVKWREDGRLDIALQRIGKGRFRDFASQLYDELTGAGGFLPFSDASTPEAIKERFGVSKKTFKRAVGTLYKEHKIRLSDEGIRINPDRKGQL